jgi:hypothetical protein
LVVPEVIISGETVVIAGEGDVEGEGEAIGEAVGEETGVVTGVIVGDVFGAVSDVTFGVTVGESTGETLTFGDGIACDPSVTTPVDSPRNCALSETETTASSDGEVEYLTIWSESDFGPGDPRAERIPVSSKSLLFPAGITYALGESPAIGFPASMNLRSTSPPGTGAKATNESGSINLLTYTSLFVALFKVKEKEKLATDGSGVPSGATSVPFPLVIKTLD